MKNKEGFTLVELLAVIIILAIISTISTPMIAEVIKGVKEKANNKTYEAIEKGAKLYIADEYNSNIENELLIPVSQLGSYVKNIPESAQNNYVYVRKSDDKLYFYYTGRQESKSNQLLKDLIINNSSMIKKGIVVNGRLVDKVIGSKDNNNNLKNYVWYSGYLWQVVEVNEDGIKMIMAYPINSISFGKSTDYRTSYVRSWLNEEGFFYDNLSRKDLLVDTVTCLDSAGQVTTEVVEMTNGNSYNVIRSINKITNCINAVSDKVGLLTLEDYAYAYDGTLNEYNHVNSSIKNAEQNKKGGLMGYNYIDTRDMFWLVTPSNINNNLWTTVQYSPSYISNNQGNVSGAKGVRPVITLKDSVIIEAGIGIKNDPYVVADGYDLNRDNNITEATIGEYIYINESNNPYESNQSTKENVRYRITAIDTNGIKVVRDEILKKIPATIAYKSNAYLPFYSYYDESVSSNLWCYYDSTIPKDNTSGCINYNYMRSIGSGDYELYKGNSIGYFLNEANNSFYSWINEDYQKIIQETKWILRTSSGDLNVSDFVKITNNSNNNKSYPTSDYDGIYSAKISLPAYGDILSGNDTATSYWYQDRWKSSSTSVGFSNGNGGSGSYSASGSQYSFGVRPVFYLNSDITILSGTGTKENPYRLNI